MTSSPHPHSTTQTFHTASEAETEAVGQRIARLLRAGDTVGLVGTLGAGKTRLVQAIASALGVERATVVSPTFTLCNEYSGENVQLYHLDLYRVADEDELHELGFEEYCDSQRITLVEWSDRFPESLPDDHVELTIDVLSETERSICFRRRERQ